MGEWAGANHEWFFSVDPSAPTTTSAVKQLEEIYRRALLPMRVFGEKKYRAEDLQPDQRYVAGYSFYAYDGKALRRILTREEGEGSSAAFLNALYAAIHEAKAIAEDLVI